MVCESIVDESEIRNARDFDASNQQSTAQGNNSTSEAYDFTKSELNVVSKRHLERHVSTEKVSFLLFGLYVLIHEFQTHTT